MLKPGGRFFISDLRRDILWPFKAFIWLGTYPKEIRPGLKTSLEASYTKSEVKQLLMQSQLQDWQVKANPIGLTIIPV